MSHDHVFANALSDLYGSTLARTDKRLKHAAANSVKPRWSTNLRLTVAALPWPVYDRRRDSVSIRKARSRAFISSGISAVAARLAR